MQLQENNTHRYRIFAVSLFILLFCYLLIRCLLNAPLQDELITFSYYIQSGRPYNNDVPIDANNHLLNTYLASIFYQLGGTGFFWLRLPNLLSFGLFFFSCYSLLKNLKTNYLRYTGLIALSCVPAFLEYFAFCRGYGLSLAFLVFSLLQLSRFVRQNNDHAFGWALFSILLAAMANLSILPLCLFVFGYMLAACMFRKRMSLRKLLTNRVLPVIIFLAGLAYLLAYSFRLKAGNALYWGGTEGLWGTTGSSLNQDLLFSSAGMWKYVHGLLLLMFALHLIVALLREKFRALFIRTDLMLVFALLSLLIFIECSFRILGLLYPLQRGGLHIALLFLLCLIFLLDTIRIGKYLHWPLLWFAAGFLLHINIYSSISSPGDRIPDTLYAKLRPYLTDSTSILCSTHLFPSFQYRQLQDHQLHFALRGEEQAAWSDLWITRTDLLKETVPPQYRLIAGDAASRIHIYRRLPAQQVRVAAKGQLGAVHQVKGENVYPLVPRMAYGLQPGEGLSFEISGKLVAPAVASNLQLHIGGFDEHGNAAYFSYTDLRMLLQGRKLNEPFRFNIVPEGLKGTEKELTIYLWSPAGEKLVIRNLEYKVVVIR